MKVAKMLVTFTFYKPDFQFQKKLVHITKFVMTHSDVMHRSQNTCWKPGQTHKVLWAEHATKSLDLFIHFWIFACELFVAKKVASVVLTKKGPENHSGNEAQTLLFLQRGKGMIAACWWKIRAMIFGYAVSRRRKKEGYWYQDKE